MRVEVEFQESNGELLKKKSEKFLSPEGGEVARVKLMIKF